MPRPNTNSKRILFRLTPDDLARLDRIVDELHRLAKAGNFQGEANRTEALRHALRLAETWLAEPRKKT